MVETDPHLNGLQHSSNMSFPLLQSSHLQIDVEGLEDWPCFNLVCHNTILAVTVPF